VHTKTPPLKSGVGEAEIKSEQPPKAPKQERTTAWSILVAKFPKAELQNFAGTYWTAVNKIKSMATTTEQYQRPKQSRQQHPFIQLDFPEIRRDKFEPGPTFNTGPILDKEDFAKAAIARKSPLKDLDKQAANALDKDLVLAIDRVAKEGENIVKLRETRMSQLAKIARSIEPLRAKLDGLKCETAKEIAAPFNAAWAAAVIDAIEWPDVYLPLKYIEGYDVVFDIPDSGVFKADWQPASIEPADFKSANTRAVKQISDEIRKSATQGNAEQVEQRKQCWKRTKEEINEGLVRKPRSKAQMDRKYGRGKWRCLGRSAILQKAKWRCIDNGKRSKHNQATTMHERITCGRADFPITVAREFAKRRQLSKSKGFNKKMLRMQHGTNDLRAAYRHVPTRQPQYTCVAVWNCDKRDVSYCDVPGHNFGLKSAVVNFNLFPELATVAARRLLWAVSEHYYDDNDTAEPEFAKGSGQACLVRLCGNEFFGFPFDPNKDEIMKPTNEFLGVISNLSHAEEGILQMDVSQKRRNKIKDLIAQIRKSGELRSGMAASVFGKSRFMLSPCYGAIGKACLQPIMQREYQKHSTGITDEIADSLEFVELVCDKLPPVELPLLPHSGKDKIVIFTDAEGKKRKKNRPPSGHVGFVLYHPEHGTHHGDARIPDELVALLDSIKQRQTYIGQFELIAAIAPFISLPPKWFQGWPVELWIDNAGAIGALLKGYSGVPDCARIVNTFHFAIAKLNMASLWIDYVPSESNPADVPSRRHEMGENEYAKAMATFGSPMHLVLPRCANEKGEWLSSVEIASSVWRM